MPNRLADESSPYLRQHQDNPVDWYPWGDEAFELARRVDKPVLLSVGYSACHWCHVMAHESFEDPDTAAVMNELFVNVKVDREERPDVDGIYMSAVQAMTGRGGWPMTVWLTPAGRPFFAGTYFPPDDRHGMPSFRRVMASVAEAWSERRDGIEDQASHLTATISREVPPADSIPGSTALTTAYRQLEASFDHTHGGFGGAPKFPQQPVLEFLLRATGRAWAPDAERMVETTLEQMAAGGIRDHVGGGFARYSVDGHWLIPHFEKMLYDNAQLARLYLRAWQVIGDDHFREIAVETLDYLARDLRHPDGGFYSAEDADSEGTEGKFYVWTESEFRSVVGPGADVAGAYFGVEAAGNFEGDNHLHEAIPLRQVAERFEMTIEQASEIVAAAKTALLERRLARVRPGLDDKIITGWNGLALRAFAEAGAVLDDDGYLEVARQNARFVLANLHKPDGRLLRSWGKGIATIPGFLDDYAGYALGLFTLYQATGEVEWYVEAERLVREMLRLFTQDGRLYSTGSDAEQLITRPLDQMDNPLPSGSSLAAEALLWLSLYTGEADLAGAAESAIRDSAGLVGQYPSAVGHLLAVLTSMDIGTREVAIVGPEPDELSRVLWESFQPELVIAIDRAATDGEIVPLLRDRGSEGNTLAYVCEGFVCRLPVSNPAELRAQLS
jgi:uncharacterized protein YyaL (SSP411 family)